MVALRLSKDKARTWPTKGAFGVVVLLAAGLLLGTFGGASSGGTRALSAAPVATSHTAASNYLITFSQGTSSAARAAAISAAGATLISSIAPLAMDTIKVPAGSKRAVLTALRANANVAGIALNRNRQSEGTVDPAYPQQWNLPQIGWDHIYGSVKPGGSSKIAVLDTGVSSAGGDLKLGKGWSAFRTKPTNDPNGHGTAVASIAAAAAGNGLGVAGVDFGKTTILPVQVLNSNGLGLDSDIVKGVVWAADHHAKVILMSFSNPGYSRALQRAVKYAWRKGAVIVAATGNGGSTAPTYPAGDVAVMGVAGTDQSDAPWADSNTGADTFIAAPATSIPADARDGSETSITGTSASAAMVAGAAALLMAKDPKATNKIVVGRLARNADPVGDVAQTGNGRLNIAKAFADTSKKGVTPRGAPGGGPIVGPYVAAAKNLAITFAGTGGGQVAVADTTTPANNTTCSATCSLSLGNTDVGTLTATASVGSVFAGWSSATWTGSPTPCTGTNSPCNFSMGGSAQGVTATFNLVVPTKLVITTAPQTSTAGVTSGTITVAREDASGNLAIGAALTVNLSTSSTGGVFRDTGDTTTITSVTIASGATSASFKYKDTVAGSPTITATTTGLTPGTQQETVNPAAASKLVFGQQPTSALSKATISPAVTVKVEDTFNNVRTSDNSTSVSLAIGTNGGTFATGTLSGGGATTASSGIATFSSLSINNVGTGYTLTASATSLTGATSSAFNITARAITVTAQTNTKTYDATTSAAATPTVTGTLAAGDTANFSETYDTKNFGSGKTLTPSGTVTDGNAGHNYTYTFVNDTTGVINKRALTVTGAANSKTYDSTTSAAATPTITSGALQGSDTANFTEAYANANAGTGKTLTPSGTVSDGNSGNNYSYTFVASTNGVINARALTVTAQANTKTYDATTSAATAPSITSGALQGSDTANFVETYDTKNVGSGKTLTPSGTVTDGNSGNNYSYTFVASTNGVINARALTVTAQTNTKTYDSTASAAAIPQITSGALQGTDTANFTEAYGNGNAGTGKTLTPSGTVTDGNGGNNYSYTFVNDTTGVINQRALTVTAQTNTKTYDSTTSAAAIPQITSGALQGTDTASFTEVYANANAGTGKTLTPSGTVADGNGGNNYSYTFVNDTTGVINHRPITITADSGQTKVYGNSDPAFTYSVTSGSLVGTDSFSGSLSRAAGEDVGTYAITIGSLAISDGNGGNNYALTYNGANFSITQRPLTITASGQSKTYGTSLSLGTSAFTTSGNEANSEQVTSVTLTSTSGNDASTTAPVGTYVGDIVPSAATGSNGFLASNYNITYVNGDLTITSATFTMSSDVRIDGTPTVGTALTITNAVFSPTPSNRTQQWQLCDSSGNSCSNIGGATNKTYTPVPGDVGSTLRIVQTVSRVGYNDGVSTSSATSVVIKGNFATSAAVAINGTPTFGTATTLTAGTYSPTPTSSSYQWRLCDVSGNNCADIGGATSSTYTPVAGDVGSTLRVVETVSKSGYNDGSSTSARALVAGVPFTTNTAVSINGIPTVDTATTLTAGSYTPTPTSSAYQWRLCDSSGNSCADISGATSSSYTPVAGDVGSTLRVVETVSKAGYNDATSTSDASPVVVKADFTTNTDVSINGTPKVATASTLTAGSYTPSQTSSSYQWQLCDSSGNSCADIGGATNATYTPVAGDVGGTLRVVETVSKAGYNDATSTSDASPVVIKASFTTTTAVAINGTPTVGTASTLTAGTFTPTPTGISYQWRLCDSSGNSCADIGGETNNTYTPVSGDIGSTLRVVETVSKAGYNNRSSTSAASPAVQGLFATNTAVAIVGTPKVGVQSTTTVGTYTPSPTGRSYQWRRCDTSGANCVAITGATYATYTPVAADAGKTLRVFETVTKLNYVNGLSTSAASPVVALGTFVKDTTVEIFGYPQVGVTSSITQGSYTPTPTSRTYQWQRCTGTTLASCTVISGATNKTYKPVSADAGKRLRVIETVSAPGYNDLSVTSSASTVVTT